MTLFLETGTHVFELTVLPDGPEWQQRTLTLKIAAGKPLTDEQWRVAAKHVVRAIKRSGSNFKGVRFVTEEL